MLFSVLIKEYVCAQCRSHLKGYWEEGKGTFVACAQDPTHNGFNTKTTVEIERLRSKLEAFRITHDSELRELFPWLPEPEHVTVEQALAELYE